MSEEIVFETIVDKVKKMGYNSATLQLALLKQGNLWKIYMARMILDMQKPSVQKTLLKTEDFALEDFSISIDEFDRFLEFLKKSYVGNVTFQGNHPDIPAEYFYKIGKYRICFVGNFPGKELYFFRRDIGKSHGIDKPLYFIDYFIHGSVRSMNYHSVDLTNQEIPFKDVLDAINHFWHVKYEAYQASSVSFPFYFPVYDASIASCEFKNGKFIIRIDVDDSVAKREELKISVIIEKKPEFRQRFQVVTNAIEIPLNSEPDYALIYLTKNGEKIDEYYYRSDFTIKREEAIIESINRNDPNLTSTQKSYEEQRVDNTTEIKIGKIKKLDHGQVFTKHDFDVEDDLCFVLMPFLEPFERIYKNHVKPTLEKSGFRVMISSDIFASTAIIQDIWEHINKANLIVADLTGKNPNVFYELGIAHSLGKHVIIITQNANDIPFDLKHLRYFSYADNEEGMMILSATLDNVVKFLRKSK